MPISNISASLTSETKNNAHSEENKKLRERIIQVMKWTLVCRRFMLEFYCVQPMWKIYKYKVLWVCDWIWVGHLWLMAGSILHHMLLWHCMPHAKQRFSISRMIPRRWSFSTVEEVTGRLHWLYKNNHSFNLLTSTGDMDMTCSAEIIDNLKTAIWNIKKIVFNVIVKLKFIFILYAVGKRAKETQFQSCFTTE